MEVILEARFTNLAGVILYWCPMLLCIIYYAKEFRKMYKKDLSNRSESHYSYLLELTIGTIITFIAYCSIPLLNLYMATKKAIPFITKKLYDIFSGILDTPVVPDTTAHAKKRKELRK